MLHIYSPEKVVWDLPLSLPRSFLPRQGREIDHCHSAPPAAGGRAREPREGLPESSCTMAEAEAAPAPPPAFPVPPLSSAAWVDETQIQGMAMEAV